MHKTYSRFETSYVRFQWGAGLGRLGGGEQAQLRRGGVRGWAGRRATETPRERDLILPKESYTPDAIALPALVYTAAAHAHNGSLYPCSVHTIHLGLRASHLAFVYP